MGRQCHFLVKVPCISDVRVAAGGKRTPVGGPDVVVSDPGCVGAGLSQPARTDY